MLTPEGITAVPPEDLERLTASMTADYATFNYGGTPRLVSQIPVVPATAGSSSIDLGWRLVVAQAPDEALEPIFTTERTTVIVGLVTLALAAVVAVGVAQLLSRPIVRLTAVAERIGAGDLKAQATVESSDEIGKLAATFNNMTTQLRTLVGSLEDRVQARTEQLRTSADVGRTAASTLEPDQLLREVVNLITDRFGFYYAAVFTLDVAGKFAVLREATGEAGRALKERGHKLEVGGQSMVGYVTAQRKARIALDVGEEAVRFANPLLPETRSEIALPLVVGDRVLGALDVQSTQEAAFDEASAAVLQAMADQIAIALNNAHLFNESQRAQKRAEELSEFTFTIAGAARIEEVCQHLAVFANTMVEANHSFVFLVDHSRKKPIVKVGHGMFRSLEQTYQELTSGISGIVFRSGTPVLSLSADDGIEPAETREQRKQEGAGALIVVPLTVNSEVIGTLTTVNRIDQRLFTQHDVDLLTTLATQTITAIEKLRLFEQTQRALSELDAINRRLTGEGWAAAARRRSTEGIMWIGTTDRAQHESLPEVTEALDRGEIATQPIGSGEQLGVAVPIKLRDVVIGVLRLVIAQRAWNIDTITTLDSIAGHVAQAAENARLLEQTQRTAQREKAIAGAADKIHRSTDLDTMMRAAIAEINRIIGLSGVSIQLGFGQSEPPDDNGHRTGTDGGK
jgi:GAF domain-containing protein/HAMP domain-containing protein